MSVLTVQAWKCDQCGHVWLADNKPKRCSKCKSMRWDSAPDLLDQAAAVAPREAVAVALADSAGRIYEQRTIKRCPECFAGGGMHQKGCKSR